MTTRRLWVDIEDDVEILLRRTIPEEAAQALGMKLPALAKAAQRHDRLDLARPLWAAAKRARNADRRAAWDRNATEAHERRAS